MMSIGILTVIICLVLGFFWIQGWFLRRIAEHITGLLVGLLFRTVLSLVTGWVIYISIVMIGMLTRIRSADDVLTIIQSRPSQIGGSATLGLALGALFAFFTFLHWRPQPQSGLIQGQPVRFENMQGRGGIVRWIRRKIQGRIG